MIILSWSSIEEYKPQGICKSSKASSQGFISKLMSYFINYIRKQVVQIHCTYIRITMRWTNQRQHNTIQKLLIFDTSNKIGKAHASYNLDPGGTVYIHRCGLLYLCLHFELNRTISREPLLSQKATRTRTSGLTLSVTSTRLLIISPLAAICLRSVDQLRSNTPGKFSMTFGTRRTRSSISCWAVAPEDIGWSSPPSIESRSWGRRVRIRT